MARRPIQRRLRSKLLDQLAETLEPHRGKKLLIAVSGGLDSVGLLDMLLQLRERLGLELIVAHADHGLRSGSAKDANFVGTLATGYGLSFAGTRLELSKGGNVEARAREARYDWLERVRKEHKADYVVTAHQADDQVETLFLHLARGSGLTGLAGMDMTRERILRPLLGVPRGKLTRYVRRRKLAYHTDPTNRNMRLARNRIRRQVITSLQRINPQLIETVSQSMRVFADEYGVLRQLAEQEYAKTVIATGSKNSKQASHSKRSGIELSLPRLRRMKKGLRHLVWREALRGLTGELTGFRLRHIENLDDLLRRATGSVAHLPAGVVVSKRPETVLFEQHPDLQPPRPTTLGMPGTAQFGDVTVRATRSKPPQKPPGSIAVDRAMAGTCLIVRSPKAGDRFKPVGMKGSKLVSDLLTDTKVPRDERGWVPVLTTESGEIVWIAGLRLDRRYVVREGRPTIFLSCL